MANSNSKLVLVIAIIVAFVVGLVVGTFVVPRFLFHRGSFPAGGSFGGSSANVVGTMFAGFRFESTSYLIPESANLSASGKIAENDFNLTTTPLANGSTEYSLKFGEIGTTYNVTIGRTDKLYFIDSNLADDMPGADASLGDDGYAVVNSTGYIVQYRYPLPNS